MEVHVLQHGLPLCGFSRDVPGKWPSGHSWTYADDLRNVTCRGCIDAVKAREDLLLPKPADG